MRYISLNSAIFLSASLYRHVFGQDKKEQTGYMEAYEPGMPMNQFHFGQAETQETLDIAAAYRLGVTTDQRVFLDDETKQEPEATLYETGIPNGDLKNSDASSNMSDTLGSSGMWEALVSASWPREEVAAYEYRANGRPYKLLINEVKLKMKVIKLCGGLFYARNIFWKGGISGNHLHQDNYFNQAQFVAGLTQATADTSFGAVVRDKPIEIMTDRTSSACSVVSSWTDNGNWGKLGDIMDHFIGLWSAPKETCAMSPSHGSGNGLQCALPCDPISPIWLESTDKYLRQDFIAFPETEKAYSVLYKLRGRFNSGDGNGGLKAPTWLNAQCDGDNLYFKETPDDPTWVVFWKE
ncbi:hypothetical protein BCIN_08g01290 [Botrytis cinerea B05.10]|uniref:Uncharacterized protein n=1 Tax=Botryotinia fuckeliana (strain B05.10) TaxID=332648 RepID=A0A384JPI3_BOTFB|nr:hypothetical protein BCIN_08g01290 [Botrytis cinerea B05.10]ATZ52391.1 hypothetical protein BCIN_08g01290 [Botrytis cinerea B05.10]